MLQATHRIDTIDYNFIFWAFKILPNINWFRKKILIIFSINKYIYKICQNYIIILKVILKINLRFFLVRSECLLGCDWWETESNWKLIVNLKTLFSLLWNKRGIPAGRGEYQHGKPPPPPIVVPFLENKDWKRVLWDKMPVWCKKNWFFFSAIFSRWQQEHWPMFQIFHKRNILSQ